MDLDTGSDSDDSSEYEYGRKALAYDPNQLSAGDGPPSNGHDYLRLVEIERSMITPCTIVKDRQMSQNNPADRQELRTSHESVEGDLLYKNEIIHNFIKLRNNIATFRSRLESTNGVDVQEYEHIIKKPAVISMNQLDIITALDSIAGSNKPFDTELVYYLIASLKTPIDADTCCSLRQLAKICISARKTNPKDLGSLLIICIVRNHFDQRDIKID